MAHLVGRSYEGKYVHLVQWSDSWFHVYIFGGRSLIVDPLHLVLNPREVAEVRRHQYDDLLKNYSLKDTGHFEKI